MGLQPVEGKPKKCTTTYILKQRAHIAITKNSAAVHYRVPRLLDGKGERGLLTSLSWRRDDAKLLHHTQSVKIGPIFHDLAVSHAVDSDPRYSRLPACWWNTH